MSQVPRSRVMRWLGPAKYFSDVAQSIIKEFEKEGIVNIAGKCVEIIDALRLRDISEKG
ncbi:MAG: hypothetical protein PF436_04970 [Prolixibacteraceae bacterium]|nr:hypothetical protein [Prolixibacteraceae bacterium]